MVLNYKLMMTIKSLTLLLYFIFITYSLTYAQCVISNVQLAALPCDYNGQFNLEIDFNTSAVQDSFEIMGNGKHYGKFSYANLPIQIGPLIADCVTGYGFLIKDSTVPNCETFQPYGVKCCEDFCFVDFKEVKYQSCTSNLFDLSIDINSFPLIDSFVLIKDSQPLGQYSKNDFPLTLSNLSRNNYSEEYNLILCDAKNKNCCDTIRMSPACTCDINNFNYQITECNELDSTFTILIDFESQFTSESFRIGGNRRNYGQFEYTDLPIRLDNLKSKTGLDYEFIIIDSQNAFCFNALELGNIDSCQFNCQIGIKDIQFYGCHDDSIFVRLEIDNQNGSIEGIDLKRGQTVLFSSKKTKKDIYHFGPIATSCNSDVAYSLINKTLAACAAQFIIPARACCGDTTCTLSNIVIEEKCSEEGIHFLILNFRNKNSGPKFALFIGGKEIGSYNYTQLPLKLLNIPQQNELLIEIRDTENNQCHLDTLFATQCMLAHPCDLKSWSIKSQECEDDAFYMDIRFDFSGDINSTFVIEVDDYYTDTLLFDQQPWSIGPFDANCKSPFHIRLSHLDINCVFDTLVFIMTCCKDSCSLSNLKIEEYCGDENIDSIRLNFNHNRVDGRFKVVINNEEVREFRYEDLPILITDLDAADTLAITVFDSQITDCTLMKKWISKCKGNQEQCKIFHVEHEVILCDSINYNELRLDFEYAMVSDSFLIINKDIVIGQWSYDELPIYLKNLANNAEYDMSIIDLMDVDCTAAFSFSTYDCTTTTKNTTETRPKVWSANKTVYVTSSNELASISLITQMGIPILFVTLNDTQAIINAHELPHGIYFVKVETNKNVFLYKVIL